MVCDELAKGCHDDTGQLLKLQLLCHMVWLAILLPARERKKCSMNETGAQVITVST